MSALKYSIVIAISLLILLDVPRSSAGELHGDELSTADHAMKAVSKVISYIVNQSTFIFDIPGIILSFLEKFVPSPFNGIVRAFIHQLNHCSADVKSKPFEYDLLPVKKNCIERPLSEIHDVVPEIFKEALSAGARLILRIGDFHSFGDLPYVLLSAVGDLTPLVRIIAHSLGELALVLPRAAGPCMVEFIQNHGLLLSFFSPVTDYLQCVVHFYR